MPTKAHGFVFREPAEESILLVARDQQSISPSYTRSYGFAVHHGCGSEVWDLDGNRYIDFAAGIAVLATGYGHPRVVAAIKDQVDRYLHIGGTDFFCTQPVNLAEKLQQIIPIKGASPEDKRVYYGNSGTEAIEAALKLARYQSGRDHVIAFYGGFHGRTMGSLSVTASKSKQRAHYPHIPGGVTHVPYPAQHLCEGKDGIDCNPIRFIEQYVLRKVAADEIAAILVEPIQGEGGYVLPTSDFLENLRAFCDDHGILLIADEIQSGMGRTGKWCAIEHWGVAPDIVCLAKGIASGLPLGAIVAHKDVMGKWTPGAHASTFGGNPVSCAAALATIDVILEEDILGHVQELGALAFERLKVMQTRHPSISRVSGKGFMIGIEFQAPDGKSSSAMRDEIVDVAYLHGLLMLGTGSQAIRFAPPLVLTKEVMEEGFDIFERAISEIEERT
jgi:4-aminobutyrate aminotransferase